MDLPLNKPKLKTLKSGLNLLLFTKIPSESTETYWLYVKDMFLIKLPPPEEISDNTLKKYSKTLNTKTLGSESNKNISFSLDKEPPTDGP